MSVRRPDYSRSGFYIDATGTTVTTAAAVAQCDRVTLDEAYTARVRARDDALNIAVLEPETPLVPLAFAQFAEGDMPLGQEITISGFSFEDMLTRPVLTFGRLDAAGGLNGEAGVLRLNANRGTGRSGRAGLWSERRGSGVAFGAAANRQPPIAARGEFRRLGRCDPGLSVGKRCVQRDAAQRCHSPARTINAGCRRSDGACVLLELNRAPRIQKKPHHSMRLFHSRTQMFSGDILQRDLRLHTQRVADIASQMRAVQRVEMQVLHALAHQLVT